MIVGYSTNFEKSLAKAQRTQRKIYLTVFYKWVSLIKACGRAQRPASTEKYGTVYLNTVQTTILMKVCGRIAIRPYRINCYYYAYVEKVLYDTDEPWNKEKIETILRNCQIKILV